MKAFTKTEESEPKPSQLVFAKGNNPQLSQHIEQVTNQTQFSNL